MDLDIYTTEMSKSIWDKAFFMDKIIGAKCVIDFGCADGAMIKYLAPLFPDITFIGYDINEELIDRAHNAKKTYPNEMYLYNFDSIIVCVEECGFKSDEICINFSSVLHEVFSSTGGTTNIAMLIDTLKPRYITIRDMYCDEPLPLKVESAFQLVGQITSVPKLQFYAFEFENHFGPIKDWRDMTHLLMKLQWVDNGWQSELNENYYSWTIDNFIDLINNKYSTSFECRYQLPYLSEKWKKKYNFYNPDLHTHAQFILRRND